MDHYLNIRYTCFIHVFLALSDETTGHFSEGWPPFCRFVEGPPVWHQFCIPTLSRSIYCMRMSTIKIFHLPIFYLANISFIFFSANLNFK